MENSENRGVFNPNHSSGESDNSGFNSDDQHSDILVPSWSDISDVSSVASVRTADLTNWDSEGPDQSGISGESSDSDHSDEEGDRGRRRRAEWRVNDRSDHAKQQFTGPQPGTNVILGPDATEFDFFELFFPAFLLQLIVRQTNLYARQKIAQKPDPTWREVSLPEMKAWLGIRVYMSIVQLPQVPMYWSTDALFGNLSIRRVMKRDRFNKISQYLHLNDSQRNLPRAHPDHDKLYLVRPVLDAVLDTCIRNYNPHQNPSIDEAMVKFRGCLSFRQYLPAKPTKYGIKVWMRADPTNGYTNEFQVYTGREGNVRETGLAARVVMDLTRRIWGHHHIVNTDNYFTSLDLADRVLQQNTYLRGTVRSNRKGFPQQQLPKNAVKQQGQFKTAQKGELTACVWMDKKPIYTLSTADNPATIETTVPRKSRGGEVRQIPAPSIVHEYNQNMNGVDVADQLRTEYSTYRTAKKWWYYLFWFLFDVSITNGFILM